MISLSDSTINAQISTLNTFMGTLFSILSGILITQYLSDFNWIIIYIMSVVAGALAILRSIRRKRGDSYSYFLSILCFFFTSVAIYQRSLIAEKPISLNNFYPASAPIIYFIWVLLLEMVLRGYI